MNPTKETKVTKLEEIRSELERHYEKYEDEYIVNFDESMFLINDMRIKCFNGLKQANRRKIKLENNLKKNKKC